MLFAICCLIAGYHSHSTYVDVKQNMLEHLDGLIEQKNKLNSSMESNQLSRLTSSSLIKGELQNTALTPKDKLCKTLNFE